MSAEDVGRVERGERCQGCDRDIDPEPLRAGADHRDDLGMSGRLDEIAVRLHPAGAADQRHRLGGCSGFVEQRGIGDLEAGEVDDHLLEVEQGLQPALRDLSLIRGVGGVPARILQQVAPDRLRRDRVVVAGADVAAPDLVARGYRGQFGQRAGFGDRLADRQRFALGGVEQDGGRHRVFDQRAPRVVADGCQHLGFLGDRGADVAAMELFRIEQRRHACA